MRHFETLFQKNWQLKEDVYLDLNRVAKIENVAKEAIKKYGGGPFKLNVKKYLSLENLVKKDYCSETAEYAVAVFGVELANTMIVERNLMQARATVLGLEKEVANLKLREEIKIDEIEIKEPEEEPFRGRGA